MYPEYGQLTASRRKQRRVVNHAREEIDETAAAVGINSEQ
jgi:hypothetical protein